MSLPKRLKADDKALLHIQQAAVAEAEASQVLKDAVATAVMRGLGWDVIAQYLGVSERQARHRFGGPRIEDAQQSLF
ncbi:hypothetical protein ACFSSC_05355 [Corynebacterium mendelii]|uniref:Uncharacterized protein n=1 Tax=Corynebacterium mendelii TaxID=2765362 RepID=A0A939ISV4_9CORY|nr:hypothetical protein [Corynebacterium mendelii]MBN9643174.1 hypothetical protein [Corynebacterium mendelii]